MKDRFIDIIDGVVAVDSVAAILNPASTMGDIGGCTIVLKSGGHIASQRSYNDLAEEFQDLLNSSPLEDVMPDMVSAFQSLKKAIATPIDDAEEPIVDTSLKDH